MAGPFYQKLTDHFKSIYHLQHLQAIVGWDQATQMPTGGNEARSDALSELAITIHQAYNLSSLEEWFERAEDESLDTTQHQSLREMRRQWQQATMLPAELVKAKSIAGSRCEHAWREQRRNNDWQGFKPLLKEVVTLSREEAKIRSSITGMAPYDTLIDQYEPDMTQQRLDQLFLPMNQWLPDLIREVQQHQQGWQRLKSGNYDSAAQKRVGLKIMEYLGFDFNHGRLDVSAHPFCGGVAEDVRITTRYESEDFSRSLMGIIHETGHARYEQNLPQQWRGLPVGQARSMGIHESQSLFFEMQLAKQQSFLQKILPWLQEELKPDLSFSELNQHYLKVEPSYIRIDADEVTYPAHILLRYQIERDLISGVIEVDDIPQMWDELMQKYLGLSTAGNYRDGCMQDIHWTDGSFGYFPSYTLGAMYAAQFFAVMTQQLPNITHALADGDINPALAWLNEHIWQQGSLHSTDKLISAATGAILNPEYFHQHLRQRYLN
ncbi:carboxypeptidase M32 [Celerinatantimonas sp. MCCC 1A17872]|uniref:carboxypeptidase M32 n=1 Tax=Celerinatantimonas sp. MCCC 1A17872 TaxID=3177514 RepID=UPI0038CBB0B3